MNKLILKITLILSLLSLSACSTTNDVATFAPREAKSDQVIVYIYRPLVMSNAVYSPDLYINDEFKLAIKNGKNTRLALTPGENRFEIGPDRNYSGLTHLSLNLKAGTTYFIRVDTSLKIKSATNYEPYERSFYLIKVDEQLAAKEIADCCISKSVKTTEESEVIPVKKETDDGFSVDKTQNPFSH